MYVNATDLCVGCFILRLSREIQTSVLSHSLNHGIPKMAPRSRKYALFVMALVVIAVWLHHSVRTIPGRIAIDASWTNRDRRFTTEIDVLET